MRFRPTNRLQRTTLRAVAEPVNRSCARRYGRSEIYFVPDEDRRTTSFRKNPTS